LLGVVLIHSWKVLRVPVHPPGQQPFAQNLLRLIGDGMESGETLLET
jgi:hypothetical protein